MADPARLSRVEWTALAVVTCIGAADMLTYSTPDAFLGQELTAQGAGSPEVMLAYGLSGAATAIACVLVLLCQSLPVVGRMSPGVKWGVVVVAQLFSVASSVIILFWPVTPAVIAGRTLHGTAAAGYLIYCLILLVELSPKQRLATGIAAMTAGMTAGDSVAPVIGAVIYDRAGFRAAFLVPAALGVAVLIMALLMYPIWHWAPHDSKEQLMQRSYSRTNSVAMIHHSNYGSGAFRHDDENATADKAETKSAGLGRPSVMVSDIKMQPHHLSDSSSSLFTIHMDHKPQAEAAAVDKPAPHSSNIRTPRTRSSSPLQPTGLDLQSVVNTLKDPVIFCQCFLLFLEQTVYSVLIVVLPATMGTATWLVGVVYIASVVGGVLSPFAVDYVVSRLHDFPTQLLAAILSLSMGISCILSVTCSTNIAALSVLLFVYGASQSAVETLVYLHVAKQASYMKHPTMIQVSMCMYIFAQNAGGGIGNLTGGALQGQVWGVQIGVMAVLTAVAAGFGFTVGLRGYLHERKHDAVLGNEDIQIIIEQAESSLSKVGSLPASDAPSSIITAPMSTITSASANWVLKGDCLNSE